MSNETAPDRRRMVSNRVGGRRSIRRSASTVGVAILALVMSQALPAGSTETDAPRPTMRIVFDQMKILIPLSLSESRWSDPKSRAEIAEALDRLENAANALEQHGRSREVGFDELALNLARDIREVQDHYREGAFEEARFFLTGSLQNCVSCHIRLPYERSFPLADELLGQMEVQQLNPREKAWLFVTVRRFESALTTWEALMHDPAVPPAQLDAGGVLVDYLNVVLRVRSDVPRASRALAALAKRSNMPVYLARRLGEWQNALEALEAKNFGPDTKPSLELGAALAREAGKVSAGPFGRDGLIQDLAAASQLVRWLELDRARRESVTKNATPQERLETAKAYYWLGVVEARSLDGFWVSLSERHLEAAIRSDPTGPFAEPAYARLEETQILGYGGASGSHLPADVWTNLKDLRELMGVD